MKGKRHSVLLAEDSVDDADLSVRAIEKCGVPCDINVARTGSEVLTFLLADKGPPPSLIVLDFHLPGFDWLEILRELRKHERTRHQPIVMLSSLVTNDQIADCLSEGARSCVVKPSDPHIYVEKVSLIVRYWLTVDSRPE